MRKLLLAHKGWFSSTAITDRWSCLLNMIKEKLGFDLAFIEDYPEISADYEIVFLAGVARLLCSDGVKDLILKNIQAKMICYMGDMHFTRSVSYQANMKNLLEKCDLFLSPEKELFLELWLGFQKKMVFYPYFFAPHERYVNLEFNENPLVKCLISGAISSHYPIRMSLLEKVSSHQDIIDVLIHPGSHGADKESAIIRDGYARLLNSYLCCVTTSVHSSLTAKYFEIMASGSLLLADKVNDFDELGAEPFKDYIPITKECAIPIIKDCVKSPERYREIRSRGMEFARKNHSIINRFEQIKELVERLQ